MQGCPEPPTLFNTYTDNTVRRWQTNLTIPFRINQNVMDTMLFADDQAVIAKTEDLQRALHKLNMIYKKYNLNISIVKTKVMAFKESDRLREK
jgi:hypothetical protein